VGKFTVDKESPIQGEEPEASGDEPGDGGVRVTPMSDTYYDHRVHQILPTTVSSGLREALGFIRYLRQQAIDPMSARPEELSDCRKAYGEAQAKKKTTPRPGLMKLRDLKPNEFRYAVAVRDGSDHFMTLFIRRDPKGDVYVMIPRGRGSENPHASYHRDGTFHQKRHDRATMISKRQPLTVGFKGCEHLGMYGGHAPKIVGVTCDATKLTGVVEVQDEQLTDDGFVAVDLVEPGCENQMIDLFNPVHSTRVFKDVKPWLVIRVGKMRKL
jgi:hypothetical protein